MKLPLESHPTKLKRSLTLAGALLALGLAATAWATPPSFQDGELLTAARLNEGFAELDRRLALVDARSAELERQLALVESRPRLRVETGTVSRRVDDAGWQLHDPTADSTAYPGRDVRYVAHITFEPPFAEPPEVMVGLASFDTDSHIHGNRVQTFTMNLTAEGFDFVLGTWADALVYAASANWIAVGESAP